MRYFLSFVLLFGWTSAYAQSSQRELPSTKELSDGILALNCVDADEGWNSTLVLTEMAGNWSIVNFLNLDQATIMDNGFVLKSSHDDAALGFLRWKSENWSIELLNDSGILQGTCTDQRSLMVSLVDAIAPKIRENANFLSTEVIALQNQDAATTQQLQKALLQLKNRESDLAQLQADLQVAQTNLQTQGAELQNTQSALEEALPLREALAWAIAERQTVDKKLAEAEIKAALLATVQAELREALLQLKGLKSDLAQIPVNLQDAQNKLEAQGAKLREAEAISSEAQRQMAVLSEEVRELMAQIGGLQSILDDYRRRDEENNVKITNLGSDLNMALAQAASEARRNLALEAVEKQRLAEEAARLAIEAKSLEQYKSDFFGRMRGLLEGIESVRIVGDRFVFSSEVLFPSGGADLSVAGRREISKVSTLLKDIAEQMPAGIDWVLQVDGHTDDQPLVPGSKWKNNWELSQARALSIVLFLANEQGMEPRRLSANGFGEFQPLNPESTGAARAQNRRIELKLTEK